MKRNTQSNPFSATNYRNLSGTLHDMDPLICTICFKFVQSPIYQCSFGKIFCRDCINNLGSKCPSCQLHLGKNRCWILERFLSVISIRCPFSADCRKQIVFNTLRDHEKYGCVVSKCYCPDYTLCGEKGSSDHIANHFMDNHWHNWENTKVFEFNQPIYLVADAELGSGILFSWTTDILFVYQCVKGEEGLLLRISCLSSPFSTFKLSYVLVFEDGDEQIMFECREMDKELRLFQALPRPSNSMVIPSRFIHSGGLKLKLVIVKE